MFSIESTQFALPFQRVCLQDELIMIILWANEILENWQSIRVSSFWSFKFLLGFSPL